MRAAFFCRRFCPASIFLLLLVLTESIQAQTNSPVGNWDCVISGIRNGLAYLTFSSDTNGGTFQGVEVLVPKTVPPGRRSGITALAGSLESEGLGVRGGAQSVSHANVVLYGGFNVNGPWSFDSHRRVTGHFLELAPDRVTCATNVVAISTNVVAGSSSVSATNVLGDATCITRSIFTNLVPGSFINETICYLDRVPISTTTFASTNAIAATNTLPDGTFCETQPVFTNIVSGTFSNQTICYINRVPVGTNDFGSPNPIFATNTLPDGRYCETMPVFTNLVAGSFSNQTICFAKQVNCSGVTNVVNFVGNVAPGKRLTLVAKSTLGGFTIRGVPSASLVDLSGRWSGVRRLNGASFELFDMAALTNTPNSYLVAGEGPGYSYEGLAILTGQKKIGFALTLLSGTNYLGTRAVIGPFNSTKLKAQTTGIEAASGVGALTNRMIFQVQKRSTVP